jgi:protein tyrosine/serine phosphatase
LIIAALAFSNVTGGVPSPQPEERTLPRFHEINANLYRGAQPLDGGIKRLSELGVKTIINLRGENEVTRSEVADARAAHLRYFSVPLPDLSAPSDEEVEKILAIINDAQNWPVFVHCNHGKDRTGLIIAVYRISHDGWTGKEAKAEAKQMGMSWLQVGMKSYIKDYYEKHSRVGN